MPRILRTLLLLLALIGAQQGALLHAVEHALHEVGIASLDHEIEECVAYDALGHALEGSTGFAGEAITPSGQNASISLQPVVLARIVFDSRAPPHSA